MSSISSIRLSGLATGMDTDAMVKSMLTADQEKIDKAQQKEQTVKWQQEIYREVMSDIIDFNDKYFSLTSKDSILSNSAWNTLSITSSNSSVISATGNAGATNVDYKFNVKKLAETAKAQSSIEGLKKESKLVSLGAKEGEQFKFELGKDDTGNTIYSSDITIEADDTIDTLITKINNSVDGKIKASYSEMTGKFTVETKDTGSNTEFKIVGEDGSSSKALDFLDLKKLGIVLKRAQYFITCRGKYFGAVSFDELKIKKALKPKVDLNYIDEDIEQISFFDAPSISENNKLLLLNDKSTSLTGEL